MSIRISTAVVDTTCNPPFVARSAFDHAVVVDRDSAIRMGWSPDKDEPMAVDFVRSGHVLRSDDARGVPYDPYGQGWSFVLFDVNRVTVLRPHD